MSYVWPILLVVVSNVLYQLCAKSIPAGLDPMASLTITYTVSAVCAAIMYFILNRGGNLFHEYAKMNFTPVLLGISIVGLEFGFIQAYKAGWSVSTASIVQSAFLTIVLIFVGALIYHEAITVKKIIGIAVCLTGIYFIQS